MLQGGKCYGGPRVRGWLIILFAGVYLLLLPALVMITKSLVDVVKALSPFQGEKVVLGLLTITACGFPLLAAPFIAINFFFPLIQPTEEGLLVRVFTLCFTWKFVPWEKIERVIPCPLWGFGLRAKEVMWVIQVSQLTCWHRFLGLVRGMGWSPIIELHPNFDNREELLEIIEAHIAVPQDSLGSPAGGG